MDHFYHKISQDWFTHTNLYSQVASQFPDGSHFVEVGSWKGRSACFLAVEIHNLDKKIKLDCVDTFDGPKENSDPSPLLSTKDRFYIEFLKNIRPVNHIVNSIRATSVSASELYDDKSLDFVFINAEDSYENVKEDILVWRDKVKIGGIIAGYNYTCDGVKKAVNEIFGSIEESEGCWIYRVVNDRPKIYDCFTFFVEKELLYLRIKHLWNYVDKFVIVEANVTHRGDKKDWRVDKLLDNELSWAKRKIIYVKKEIDIDNLPPTNYAKEDNNTIGSMSDNLFWRIENYQRNAILDGIKGAKEDDIIMIGDLDEFPNNAAMDSIPVVTNVFSIFCFVMHSFSYYMNVASFPMGEMLRNKILWAGTVVGKRKFLDSPQSWRDMRAVINWEGARGYHFSNLKPYFMEKCNSSAHGNKAEMENNDRILDDMEKLFTPDDYGIFWNHINYDYHFRIIDIKLDDLYPKAIIEESVNFPHLFYKNPTNE